MSELLTIEQRSKVLVCGGRDFADRALLERTLDGIAMDALIHGDATGADRLAGEWAKKRGVPVFAYPAQWIEYGRAAGPIRNERMLRIEKPNLVLAFRGGRDTAGMVRLARENGVPVRMIV